MEPAPSTAPAQRAETTAATPARAVAVLDVGTTSIRLTIAQIDAGGRVTTLENLSQPVALGEDTFRRGQLRKSTIEGCAQVLKSYRRLLDEYQITAPEQIRAIATSAVSEAANREAFLDRVYIATGIRIDVIDEAEVNRLTYLAIQPLLSPEQGLGGQTLVVEVGGGMTKLLLLRDRDVIASRSNRLGSLRLREMIEAYKTPRGSASTIMQGQIQRSIKEIVSSLPEARCDHLLALGGDVRFAAARLLPDWDPSGVSQIQAAALSAFTAKIAELSVDELVREYHLSYPDAETAGPALRAYLELARALDLKSIHVAGVTLRDGFLTEMAASGSWTSAYKEQIIRSALALGRKYLVNEEHALRVADLADKLFVALEKEHRLDERFRLVLYIAALLHEVGLFVSNRSHHKHSMYLIQNSELFGLGQRDLLLVALVARYHRRASPKPTHFGYATLERESRIVVNKLAAILRVADALERSHSQRVQDISSRIEDGRFVIAVAGIADLSLEQLALKQKGAMFEETYGLQVMLRKA